jgi:hypothetical protein
MVGFRKWCGVAVLEHATNQAEAGVNATVEIDGTMKKRHFSCHEEI